MDTPRLAQRPEARPFTIEALLDLVRRGKIRLPDFQRPLRWRTPHVTRLFDSVYRGLPVGALLLFQRDAEAETIGFGVYRQEAPKVAGAYFVVDGQQRIAALAGALLHPSPVPRGDVHAIWFDLEKETFHRLSRREPDPAWIPLNVLGDSKAQMRWILAWPYRVDRDDLVEKALEVGKAIREYALPAYILHDASEEVLREVYRRINDSGVPMKESEVFTALFHSGGQKPLQSACRRLSEMGFGTVTEELFLTCLKSVEGVEPRRTAAEGGEALAVVAAPEHVARTEEALRRTIEFLIEDAGVPHMQLLPYELAIALLSRFFHAHRQPVPRTRLLLSWWVWRGALSGEHRDNSQATFRGLRSLVDADESASIERLLDTVPREPPFPTSAEVWNGQAARTRLCALAMLSLAPRDPRTSQALDLAEIQAWLDSRPLHMVFPDIAREKNTSVSRHVCLPRQALKHLARAGAEVLASHGIDAGAAEALRAGEIALFERRRGALLDAVFARFFAVRCGKGENERPAISALVARAEQQVRAA